jgi:hypothetical protein
MKFSWKQWLSKSDKYYKHIIKTLEISRMTNTHDISITTDLIHGTRVGNTQVYPSTTLCHLATANYKRILLTSEFHYLDNLGLGEHANYTLRVEYIMCTYIKETPSMWLNFYMCNPKPVQHLNSGSFSRVTEHKWNL